MRGVEYDYSNCRIMLLKIDTDKTDIDNDGDNLEIDYVAGTQSWDRDTHIEVDDLEKGEYYVYVELDWNENTTETNFVATCYGCSKSVYTRNEKALYPKELVLQNAMRCKAFHDHSNDETITTVTMADKGAPNIKKYKQVCGPEGYGFIVIHNEEKEATYKENVRYNTFTGLEFVLPETGTSYTALVKPGETKTIVIKCDPEGYGMATSSSAQVILGDSTLL